MHCDRLAASLAAWMAGSKSAIRTPMMAITTKSSISVNPPGRDRGARLPLAFLGDRRMEPSSDVIRAGHRAIGARGKPARGVIATTPERDRMTCAERVNEK